MSDAFILPATRPVAYVVAATRQRAYVMAATRRAAGVYVRMGMTTAERELLHAVAAQAMQRTSPLTLWKQGGVEFANTTGEGQPGGDTTHLALTTSYQILAQGPIPKHSWRGQGTIHIRAVFGSIDTAAAESGSIGVALISRPDWPTAAQESTSTRGKLTTPVTHLEFASGKYESKGGSQESRVVLDLWIDSEGQVGSEWPYTVSGRWLIEGDDPVDIKPLKFSTAYDPTTDRLFELHAKAVTLAGTETKKLKSTVAWFYDFRPGFGYEG